MQGGSQWPWPLKGGQLSTESQCRQRCTHARHRPHSGPQPRHQSSLPPPQGIQWQFAWGEHLQYNGGFHAQPGGISPGEEERPKGLAQEFQHPWAGSGGEHGGWGVSEGSPGVLLQKPNFSKVIKRFYCYLRLFCELSPLHRYRSCICCTALAMYLQVIIVLYPPVIDMEERSDCGVRLQ